MAHLLSADDVAQLLDLTAHPEGGSFRETFRDLTGAPHGDRGASTAIYFMLRAGEASRWHRVDAAEGWHFYAGAPLLLEFVEAATLCSAKLGVDLAGGERPQTIVPKLAWQRARSLGNWTLVGCTVAPAFTFAGFELADAAFDPLSAITNLAR
ncbi:MAG: cupin domain-containing protein [Hyphomicrobium sp.]|nr:cupin domain-containing protein [Hyphomicrobium sp.]